MSRSDSQAATEYLCCTASLVRWRTDWPRALHRRQSDRNKGPELQKRRRLTRSGKPKWKLPSPPARHPRQANTQPRLDGRGHLCISLSPRRDGALLEIQRQNSSFFRQNLSLHNLPHGHAIQGERRRQSRPAERRRIGCLRLNGQNLLDMRRRAVCIRASRSRTVGTDA